MKKFSFLWLGLVFLILPNLFSSCDGDGGNVTPAGEGTVTSTVDGNSWQSSPDGRHSSVGAIGVINTGLNITIQAYAEDGSYIALNTVSLSTIVEGTAYESGSGFFQGQYKQDFGSIDSWQSLLGSGTITFSNISSTNISGTFSMTASHPTLGDKIVDGGNFDIDL